jgi:ribulose 1,5-bisphosphate synthetase/thiazole synthase
MMARGINRRALLKACAAGAALSVVGAPSGAAENKPNTFRLTRDIPVEDGYDLVVAGGGPAGAAAAISAARLGAKVLLVEATGCLGGMGTSGLVTEFGPMTDGEKMMAGGLMREVVETLYQRGFINSHISPDTWRKAYYSFTPFNVEGYKLILDELTTKSGVEVCFFTKVIDVDADARAGQVHGVIVHNIEGYRYIPAKTFVDGTGDAVLAALCGVKCREAGRDTPHIMPATLCSLCANLDWTNVKQAEPNANDQAIKDGFLTQPDKLLPGFARVGETVGILNAGHLFDLNSLRCKSLTDGMMLGRRLAQEYVAFYRKYVPGCEKLEHVTTASLMGVRESRRIVGEYELSTNDFLARRQFPDQIAVFAQPMDGHPYDTSQAEFDRWHEENQRSGKPKVGECFGIPYGILVPQGWKNLWVPGRSACTDVKVNSATRTQPASSMMGQAAGTAAVQSIRDHQPAAEIDTEALVATLRKAGAYLPQTRTSKTLTRAV